MLVKPSWTYSLIARCGSDSDSHDVGDVAPTAGVSILVVGIQTLVQKLGHLVYGAGLDVIHEFLQTGLKWKRSETK